MEIKVPDLGVEKAEVSEILVAVGQSVTEGQSLMLVESAKASLEIPSPQAGVVSTILVKKGDTIKEGMALLFLRDASTEDTSDTHTPLNTSETLPDMAQSIQPEIPNTQQASMFDETELATHQIAPVLAPPAEPLSIKLSDPIPSVSAALTTPISTISAPAPSPIAPNGKPLEDVYAGPATRQLARKMGVDIRLVTAQATNGRLVKEDVYAYVATQLAKPTLALQTQENTTNIGSKRTPLPLVELQKWGASEIQPLPKNQQFAIKHLQNNAYIPQVTQFDLADITELEAFRQQQKNSPTFANSKLTLLPFIVKAVATALKQPQFSPFNAHLMDDDANLLVRQEVHMGIAMASNQGLMVPVLRQPDTLGIADIASQLSALQQKAQAGKLIPSELSGATFTISSLGNKSGTGFTPLVSFPQVVILGISPATLQPVWNGSTFVPRLMLPLSLSYDHRVINGSEAADFCACVARYLTDIRLLVL